jgi:hypothetical protein
LKRHPALACLTALLALSFALHAQISRGEKRDPERDLVKAAGRQLDQQEREIASYVLAYYSVKFGHGKAKATIAASLSELGPEEYALAIGQAARIAVNPAARGLLKTGKKGEKIIKALIVAAEDAARAADAMIDRKAKEYDERH